MRAWMRRNRMNPLELKPLDVETEQTSLIDDSATVAGADRVREEKKPGIFSSVTCARVLLALVLIALSASLVWIRIDYDKRISSLEKQLLEVNSRLNEIDKSTLTRLQSFNVKIRELEGHEKDLEVKTISEIQKQNRSTVLELSSLRQVVDTQQSMLVRLSNGTSNADVLDKLEETKELVTSKLVETQVTVKAQLEEAQNNVTTQLDSKVQEMHRVVTKTTNNIQSMEKNLTGRLNQMSQQLRTTVGELNQAVAVAQDTITEEVESVRENIRQYVAITNQQFAAENDFVKYQLAGFFTLLSCLIFLWHMTSHSRHYHKPDVQRRVMAFLWMVPIYGITSWLSLVNPTLEPYFATLRDCFEAYVVYTFVGFLIAILSDGMTFNQLLRKLTKMVEEERESVENYNLHQAQQLHETAAEALPGGEKVINLTKPKEHLVPPFPCCYRQDDARSIAAAWLYQCQLMAMQFVITKPLLTLIPLLVAVSGAYDMEKDSPWGDNTLNWSSPKLYILFCENVSVALAFYGLLSLYHGVEKDLAWCDPWPKFLCIKAVVFATFWQNIAIEGMTMFDLVNPRAASQISNLLICIEMLAASIAHIYIFPYQEWEPGYQKVKERTIQIRDTMALGDFLKDMKMMVTKWEPDKAHRGTPDHRDELLSDVESLNETTLDRLVQDRERRTSTPEACIQDDGIDLLNQEYNPLLVSEEHNPFYTELSTDVNHFLQEEFERRVERLSATNTSISSAENEAKYYQILDSEDRASV